MPLSAALPALVMLSVAQADDTAAEVALTEPATRYFDLSVPVRLNGRYLGDASVRAGLDGTALIDAERFAELIGTLINDDVRSALLSYSADGDGMVPVSAFRTEGVTVRYDPGLLEVTVTARVDVLGERRIALATLPPPDPKTFARAAAVAGGLNVRVGFEAPLDTEDETSTRTDLNGFVNLFGFEGITLYGGADIRTRGGEVDTRRRPVFAVRDDFERALRLTVGDVDAPVAALQAPLRLLGVTLARDYQAIRPFQNLRSAGLGAFVLDEDARVEVFVNGASVELLNLPSGRYEISDFPFTGGANDVRIVAQTETGLTELATFSFFSRADLLGEGILDFGLSAGVDRANSADGFEYGDDLYATGFLEYGLTSRLSVGANFQSVDDLTVAGATATAATPLGLIAVDAAASLHDSEVGWTARFRHTGTLLLGDAPLTFSSIFGLTDENYLTPFGGRSDTAASARSIVRARLPYDVDANLSTSWTKRRDAGNDLQSVLTLGRAVGRYNLTATLSYEDRNGEDAVAALIGVTARLGNRSSGRVAYDTRQSSTLLNAHRIQAPGINTLGGSVSARLSDARDEFRGGVTYRHNRFEGDLGLVRVEPMDQDASTAMRGGFETFVGAAGGKVAIGRPASSGFAIVSRHKSLRESALRVVSAGGNQTLAEAGLLGPALVPEVGAYVPRRLQVAVDPLPVGYDLGAGGFDVMAGAGTGYAFTVGSDASRTVLGTLTDANGEPLALAVGQLERVDGDETLSRQFFTSRSGRFVVERVASGEYELVLGEQRQPITIEEDTEGIVDVGSLTIK